MKTSKTPKAIVEAPTPELGPPPPWNPRPKSRLIVVRVPEIGLVLEMTSVRDVEDLVHGLKLARRGVAR